MKKNHVILLAAGMVFSLSECSREKAYEQVNCSGVTYKETIRPILEQHCAISGCHRDGFPVGDYTTYQGIKAKADNGTLTLRVLDLKIMPPPTQNDPLNSIELEKFRCWINNGAPE